MKKMYVFLISLICAFLTACGSKTSTAANNIAPTPESATIVETVPIEPQPEKPEEPTPTQQPKEDKSSGNSSKEPNDDCFIDGVFYPIEYAKQLGFKIYEQSETEDCFSKTHNGTEYFMRIDFGSTSIYWVKDGLCYGYTLYETFPYLYIDNNIDIHTGTSFKTDDSLFYYDSMIQIMNRVNNNTDLANIKNWTFDDLSNSYAACDCDPAYWPDGFINSNKYNNVVEEINNYAEK